MFALYLILQMLHMFVRFVLIISYRPQNNQIYTIYDQNYHKCTMQLSLLKIDMEQEDLIKH